MSVISVIDDIMHGFNFMPLLQLILGVVPALICITLHELSHGYVAYKLGDSTAKAQGRLSLNPLKHIDIMGLIMMVVFHVGWAKPVPVNMMKFNNPKRDMAITALAGPVSNVLISAVCLFIYGLLFHFLLGSSFGEIILLLIELTAEISIGLGLFNLLPFPPLDGSKVLFSLLSNKNYYKLMHYEKYGMIVLFVLVISGVLSGPLNFVIDTVYGWLTPIAQFSGDLVYKLFF